MLFLTNPRKRRARKSRRRKVSARKPRRRVRRVARPSTGGSMARKRGRRRARRAVSRRRRRRGGKTAAVALRRRGVTVYRSNPRRRRRRGYRRNVGGSIVSTLKTGVKEGAVVLIAQVATRKAINIASKFVPIGGIAGQAVSGLGTAVVVTIAARKVAPQFARLASAAAFAEALRGILASTPIGGLLGDGAGIEYMDDGMGAYPEIPANMGAYPGGGLGDAQDEAAMYVN